jgi:hypothetical protein
MTWRAICVRPYCESGESGAGEGDGSSVPTSPSRRKSWGPSFSISKHFRSRSVEEIESARLLKEEKKVEPDRRCLPRHRAHFETSFLELISGPARCCLPCRRQSPCFLSQIAPCDVASHIYQAGTGYWVKRHLVTR